MSYHVERVDTDLSPWTTWTLRKRRESARPTTWEPTDVYTVSERADTTWTEYNTKHTEKPSSSYRQLTHTANQHIQLSQRCEYNFMLSYNVKYKGPFIPGDSWLEGDIGSNGLFTLHGNRTGTGTGNWSSTIGNNGSRFPSLSRTSVNISVQYIRAHCSQSSLSLSRSGAVWISHKKGYQWCCLPYGRLTSREMGVVAVPVSW